MTVTHTPSVGSRELLEALVGRDETTLLVAQREACLPVLQGLGDGRRGGRFFCRWGGRDFVSCGRLSG